ncbi:MAG: hypothetical protein JOY71_23335 [Acetobacteraceae bacterium]|nr:hypothetical protein [Acetobacteraceae bacterium]MBV8525017.1 hypothetical protein [Acetobacteraceae bacterium]
MQNMLAALRAGVPLARFERWCQRATPGQFAAIEAANRFDILVSMDCAGGPVVTINQEEVRKNPPLQTVLNVLAAAVSEIEYCLQAETRVGFTMPVGVSPVGTPSGFGSPPSPVRRPLVLRRMEAGPVVISGTGTAPTRPNESASVIHARTATAEPRVEAKPRKKKPTRSYREKDAELANEILKQFADQEKCNGPGDQPLSLWALAWQMASRAEGLGSLESKAKRLMDAIKRLQFSRSR